MYQVIIADDQDAMRSILSRMIERKGGFELVGEAKDGETALRLVEEKRPQVVFLDIEMPGMSGVETARAIQDIDPGIIIVFATAHDDYMGDAFELYAFDYLLKPFKLDRLEQTLERISERLTERSARSRAVFCAKPVAVRDRMLLRHRDGVSFVDYDDILLIQREDRSTVLYLRDGEKRISTSTLLEMEERLPREIFFRCHKSYIVNLHYIKDITPYGRWTYVVHLEGIAQDALITHEKYDELEKLFQ